MYPKNQEIILHFKHYKGTTGIVQADFTASLLHNGLAASESFVIEHVGNGFYSFTFTPEDEGVFFADVVETADLAARYQEEIRIWDKEALLDVSVSSRLAAASYTTPPTAVAVRQEVDANSTQLAAIIATMLVEGDLASLEAMVTRLKKYAENNIERVGETLTVKDDDELSTLAAFHVSASGRMRLS